MSDSTGLQLQHPTQHVLLALLPGALISSLFLGWGVLVNLALTISSCIACENLVLKIRQQAPSIFSRDLSAVLTGSLLALSLPPSAPWWLCVVGGGIAILLGKYLLPKHGGVLFNPAMLGFVVLLIAFPAKMSNSYGEQVVDALSSATPLDTVRSELRLQRTFSEITTALPHANDWMWISLAYLLGGIYLLWRGIIRWPVPVAVLAGLLLPALCFWAMDADRHASPLFHALSGASMLGAFFIATDPNTAPSCLRGRLIYGAGIGLLVFIIRSWGRYPDGFGFAVLLMNLSAPAVEKYLNPPRPKAAFARGLFLIGLSLSYLLIIPYQQSWARLSLHAQPSPLQELLPAGSYDNNPTTDTLQVNDPQLAVHQYVTVYRARNKGAVVATVFDVITAEGYNGDIELLVGIRADGTLLGVRTVRHQETRGLGDKIELENSNWVLSFNGRSLNQPSPEQWALKNNGGAFDQFSGASITPRAVVASVKRTLEYFSQHRTELLSAP